MKVMQIFKSFLYNSYQLISLVFSSHNKHYWGGQQKSKLERIRDQLYWLRHEGMPNKNYYLQGIDRKKANIREFIGTKEFISLQQYTNKKLAVKNGFSDSFDLLLKDKFVFGTFARALNLPIIPNIFLINSGKLFQIENNTELSQLKNGKYFIKNVIIESGKGVVQFQIKGGKIYLNDEQVSEISFLQMFSYGVWIIQPRINSHQKIQEINRSALNTTRIYTMNTGSEIEIIGGYQAFATDNAKIDSWQHGSVYVGIDIETGKLHKYGLTNQQDKRGGLLSKHPNSEILFKDFKLPYFKESIELCKQAHSFLYGFFVIGWDIAITDRGPMIVEANEKPGINVLQSVVGGIKSKLKHGLK